MLISIHRLKPLVKKVEKVHFSNTCNWIVMDVRTFVYTLGISPCMLDSNEDLYICVKTMKRGKNLPFQFGREPSSGDARPPAHSNQAPVDAGRGRRIQTKWPPACICKRATLAPCDMSPLGLQSEPPPPCSWALRAFPLTHPH